MKRSEMWIGQKVMYTPPPTLSTFLPGGAIRPKMGVEYDVIGIFTDTCCLRRAVAEMVETISGVEFGDVTPVELTMVGYGPTIMATALSELDDRSNLERWDEI